MSRFIVFCYGDSSRLSTWSNVPYFLTDTLRKKGHTIHRVDITPPTLFSRIYDATIRRIIRLASRGSQHSSLRSWFSKIYIEKIIRQTVRKESEADYCLFFGFDYYNRYNHIPSILLGDWTFEILLKDRLHNSSINCIDRRFIRQQNSAIKNASLVISLFPDSAKKIKTAVPESNVHYLGRNVVNNAAKHHYSEKEILTLKQNSTSLLFIGNEKYLEGAELLIDAFRIFNKISNGCFSLHIIGLSETVLRQPCPDNVFLHGYIDKADDEGNNLYYKLVSEAKVIINPTPGWAGYSSIIEAMFYFTPVIVSPFSSFVEEFGEKLTFGQYFIGGQTNSLVECIHGVVYSSDYLEQCIAAHNAVKDYTWSAFIDHLLSLL